MSAYLFCTQHPSFQRSKEASCTLICNILFSVASGSINFSLFSLFIPPLILFIPPLILFFKTFILPWYFEMVWIKYVGCKTYIIKFWCYVIFKCACVRKRSHMRSCNDRLPLNSFIIWKSLFPTERYFWYLCKYACEYLKWLVMLFSSLLEWDLVNSPYFKLLKYYTRQDFVHLLLWVKKYSGGDRKHT